MLNISEERLQVMFERYIDAMKNKSNDCAYGRAVEATEWLRLFGIDLSYERIHPMIVGEAPVRAFDDTLEEDVWYVEKWKDDDLIEALESEDVEVTQENFDMLREACIDMFEDLDLSDRNEMICDKVRELFC